MRALLRLCGTVGYHNEKNMNKKDIINTILCGEIKKSTIHGYGLFATEDIPKGVILTFLDGQKIGYNFYLKKKKDWVGEMKFHEWNAIENDNLIVRFFRTKYSFINHSRQPNCFVDRYPHSVVTLKQIKKGEEFTLDYRKEPLPQHYLENHGKTYL